jgi:hypothetical protein
MGNLSGSMEKDPAPFAMPGAIHQGVGHASIAEEIPARSMEHEGMVGKLHNRQFPRVHHELERLDPRTCLMRRHLHASIGDAHSNLAAAASDFALGCMYAMDTGRMGLSGLLRLLRTAVGARLLPAALLRLLSGLLIWTVLLRS